MFYLRFPLFLTLFLPPEVVRAPGPRQQPKQARLLCLSPEFESSLRESSSPALDKLPHCHFGDMFSVIFRLILFNHI